MSGSFASYVDIAVVCVSHETMPSAFELLVELVEDDVAE
jgi:hypothetical protein